MTDIFKPCPFCKGRVDVHEAFGKLVAGCVNKACAVRPDTWGRGPNFYDIRKVAQYWNSSIK